MKEMKWKLDLSFFKQQQGIAIPDKKEVFKDNLIIFLRKKFKDGLNIELQRRLFSILNKIDSVNDNDEYLSLEDAEFDLIKSCIIDENVKSDPSGVFIHIQMADFIEEALKKK